MRGSICFGLILGILLSFFFLVPNIAAQESATIQATATVLSAITVVGQNNLMFETVIPGINKTVDKATVGRAGAFQVNGKESAEITLDLTLPDSLHIDSTAAMRIGFSNTDASYDDGSGGGQTVPQGIINPNGPVTQTLGLTGQLNIWVGGTVSPNITQTGGDYAADIRLTVAYTGN
ncbi:MAG: hypothetical protein NTV06_07320 [candidate division Zixibacteria bacterium]|nr:hypothetical protein [candidate division Zixibacteria bacterium]